MEALRLPNFAYDGRTTMRIVFAETIQRILLMPSAGGRIPDTTVLSMRMLEATAHPWIRDDKEFLQEIKDSGRLSGDQLVLARWTATLAGLKRANMLDKPRIPRDYGDDAQPGVDEGLDAQA